jgi:6-phosphogluconate dehydrogenase
LGGTQCVDRAAIDAARRLADRHGPEKRTDLRAAALRRAANWFVNGVGTLERDGMHTAEIGLIGLGVMGSNLALNIAEKGHRIAVWNRTAETTHRFAERAGALGAMIVPCDTLAELAAAIRPPRPIILMVPAGGVVDEQIHALRPLLSADDILIDAGNANFRDTMRRFDELDGSGIAFIGRRPGCASRTCWSPSPRATATSPAWPIWDRMAPVISSRRSTTASNMPTCR